MIKKILLGLLGVVVLVGIGGYAYYRLVLYVPPLISQEDRNDLTMMPLPATMEFGRGVFQFDESFGIIVEGSTPRLERAVQRFSHHLSGITGHSIQGSQGMVIRCAAPSSEYPGPVEDESYVLEISTSGISLTAPTEFGVLRGLQTILQLVEENSIRTLELTDSARFPWRGIMIDVSRHWIPKEVILRNLDAMEMVKMNVLHLHLSDDQGFRVESKTFPLLHQQGSNGDYFTQADIREIIEYAADRGIRIVPEFDVPGHTKSWLVGYPEIASAPGPYLLTQRKGASLFSVPMDPTKEATYTFLDAFFEEMTTLFPDAYMHLGGDEVNGTPWMENDDIRGFMEENSLADAHELQAYFNERLVEIIRGYGKKVMGWEEVLEEGLSREVLVQSWKNQKTLFQAVQQGHQAILSAGLYLDHKLHTEKHYSVDPLVLPGAVDIEPDTGQWSLYDMTMEIPGNSMETQLVVFDRNPDQIFGFFAFMDDRNAFTGGTMNGNQITFQFDAAGVGDLGFTGQFVGDSITGEISLGFMSFATNGNKTGGSDMEGSEMPMIEVVKPLSPEEEMRILGGEAAMWSEVVSGQTIDSRIWPRTAAIAEKLWSPAELTADVEDMYRRLSISSDRFERIGLTHTSYGDQLLQEIGKEAYEPLKKVISLMEEAKYYNRMAGLLEMEDLYLPDLPLVSLADAAYPESVEARRFNALVQSYRSNPDEASKAAIVAQLQQWSTLYSQLSPYFESSKRMQDIQGLTRELSSLSKLALDNVQSGVNEFEQQEISAALNYLETGENGVVVAIVPGLRAILQNP